MIVLAAWVVSIMGLPFDLVLPRTAPPAQAYVDGCTSGPAWLRELVATAWRAAPRHQFWIRGCVEGRFPEPAWYIVAVERTQDDAPDGAYAGRFAVRRALVTRQGILAEADEAADFRWLRFDWSVDSVEAVDFDADGRDELVEYRHYERRCIEQDWLHIVARVGAKLEERYQLLASCSACSRHTDLRAATIEYDAHPEIVRAADGKRHIVVDGAMSIDKPTWNRRAALRECAQGDSGQPPQVAPILGHRQLTLPQR